MVPRLRGCCRQSKVEGVRKDKIHQTWWGPPFSRALCIHSKFHPLPAEHGGQHNPPPSARKLRWSISRGTPTVSRKTFGSAAASDPSSSGSAFAYCSASHFGASSGSAGFTMLPWSSRNLGQANFALGQVLQPKLSGGIFFLAGIAATSRWDSAAAGCAASAPTPATTAWTSAAEALIRAMRNKSVCSIGGCVNRAL